MPYRHFLDYGLLCCISTVQFSRINSCLYYFFVLLPCLYQRNLSYHVSFCLSTLFLNFFYFFFSSFIIMFFCCLVFSFDKHQRQFLIILFFTRMSILFLNFFLKLIFLSYALLSTITVATITYYTLFQEYVNPFSTICFIFFKSLDIYEFLPI